MRAFRNFDPAGAPAVALYLSACKLLLHLLTNGRYGYFRDELYYLACGEHLDWGYVDQAPLIAVVAWAQRAVLGDSLLATRFLPALAGAALVFVTGLLARALKTGDARLWVWFGLSMGLGLQNKHSTLVFGFAVVAGLLLTPARRFFLSKWLWVGGLVALVVFLPNILWQVAHGWPTAEVLRNADKNQNLPVSPLDFFKGQLELTHPLAFPVWLAGLCFYLFARAGRPYRALGLEAPRTEKLRLANLPQH